jgi:hypothetical protein
MVTHDVTDDATVVLASVFTHVVRVPYITKKVIEMRTKKQRLMYGAWIHQSFTKLHVLNPQLFAYDKVVLLDADMLFVANCDHLMQMHAPAATFSTPWAKPFCNNGGLENMYRNAAHAGDLEHGEVVPRELVEQGRARSFVCRASVVVLEPSTEQWHTLIDILRGVDTFGTRDCFNGFDEQAMVDVWLKLGLEMRNVHQRYNWVVGKTQWLEPGVEAGIYQWYGQERVWNIARTAWPDAGVWWARADEILKQMPAARNFFPRVRRV